MTYQATIKSTGERIRVYKLRDGNYADYDNMGMDQPPKAMKANKKVFTESELTQIKEENQ